MQRWQSVDTAVCNNEDISEWQHWWTTDVISGDVFCSGLDAGSRRAAMSAFHLEHEDDQLDEAGRDAEQDLHCADIKRLPLHWGGTVHTHVLAWWRALQQGVRSVGDGGLSPATALTQRHTIASHRWLRNQLQEHCHHDH